MVGLRHSAILPALLRHQTANAALAACAQIAEAQQLAREWKPKTWDELKGNVGSR